MVSPDLDAPDDADAPASPSEPERGPAFVVAVSLAVLFAVVAAVLAVLVVRPNDDTSLDDLRESAGRFGEALVTYDYHDPDVHRDLVLSLATGSFRQDYQDAFDQGLGDIITEVEAVSKGSVNDVFVTSVEGGQAQAIVSLDIEVSGTSGPRSINDQYVLLTLIKLDDGWKVDQVTDLSFPTASPTPVTGDTTTTTSQAPTPSIP